MKKKSLELLSLPDNKSNTLSIPSQLSWTSRASAIISHAEITNCFTKKDVPEKTMEISRHLRVVLMYIKWIEKW